MDNTIKDIVGNYYGEKKVNFSLDDIDRLARKAASLEPLSEETLAGGCLSALTELYKNSEEYDALLLDQISRSRIAKFILFDNVNIALYERNIRMNGFDSVNIEYYKNAISKYQRDVNSVQQCNDELSSTR
jgi:hypothetical protein